MEAPTCANTTGIKTITVPIDQLHANTYNPNRMTEEEFAELVLEVRHLGRLPKPIVVRRNQQAYEIIDGEHGWKAAKEVGLPELDCEVIEADDFESMRQTYKRNQHGAHNPLLLGKMFQQMIDARGLSRRKLAEEVEVSEGTIRNALEYVKAEEVRNSYAPSKANPVRRCSQECSAGTGGLSVGDLSLREVRAFNWLPPRIANMWLDTGADLKVIYGVRTNQQAEEGEGEGRLYYSGRYLYHDWENTGLVDFVGDVWEASGFRRAMETLRKWDKWERSWLVGPLREKREQLREYTKHYFEGVWYVREQSMIDEAFDHVIDRKNGEFLLTPEEFADCIAAAEAERSSAMDFWNHLSRAVVMKHSRLPDNKYHVKRDLMQFAIDQEAPDYIKESKLPVEAKHDLLELYQDLCRYKEDPSHPRFARGALVPEYTEEALRAIALTEDRLTGPIRSVDRFDAMEIQGRIDRDKKTKDAIASLSEGDLAEFIVWGLYDKDNVPEEQLAPIEAFRKKLATFDKPELLVLKEVVDLASDLAKRRAEIEETMAGVKTETEEALS